MKNEDIGILLNTNYSSNPKVIKDALSSKALGIKRQSLSNPGLSYFGKRTGGFNDVIYSGFKNHEYDLFEYSRIIDTEAIVAKAFERQRALIFKNGYYFESNNPKNVEYIKSRIREIEYVTGLTFRNFIEEMAYNLVMFHNSYILVVRNENKSTGETVNVGNKELEPIAGWFNLPTETIQRKLKENGDVEMYKQYLDPATFRLFSPEKVRHLKYNARSGFTMGTPPLEAVKDDILALRRIEESVETLIYKGIFPMIHVKVGTESNPAKILIDGSDEVEKMGYVMQELDEYGGITTSERVEVKAIGSESLALRVESYLEYFKDRVMLGLGVSDIDMGIGDSSGKATGQIISQTLKEAVINKQDAIAEFITHVLFKPLLVESGMYEAEYMIPEEDLVKFKFNHVDQDARIKIESHILNMFNSGLLSINEARLEIGYKEIGDKEISRIGKDKEMILPTYQVETAKIAASAAAQSKKENSSGNKTKADGAKKASVSKTNPKNQFSDSLSYSLFPVDEIRAAMPNKELLSEYIENHVKLVVDISDSQMDNNVKDIVSVFSDSLYLAGQTEDVSDSYIEDSLMEIYELIGGES
jgi:hypothetical protein|nr:MAG TPA: Portal protein [Bacteriophage sp.]